mmetsp:Transcript_8628/g.21997  ORF Transcript_8628/g.21997 Transcript_8628/m.21997 type:complete len:262 (+) Transcript_8628:49-834(+)
MRASRRVLRRRKRKLKSAIKALGEEEPPPEEAAPEDVPPEEAPKKRLREDTEAKTTANDGPRASTTVYCEGLSYQASEADVAAFFAPLAVLEVRMPRYQDSGKPRGYAHVDFETAADAAEALSKDRESLKGRYVTVCPAKEKTAPSTRPRPAGCRTVFVKNLPYETNEDAVRTAFRRFGKIDDVRLPIWGHTRRLKGHGYVQFVREFDAEQAYKLQHAVKLGGRDLVVDYDDDARPKASFRTLEGRPWAKTRVGKRLSSSS